MNIEINNIFTNILNKYSKIDEPYKNDLSLEDKDIRARQFQNNQRALSLGSDDENELQKLNDFLLTLRNGGDDDDDCKPCQDNS